MIELLEVTKTYSAETAIGPVDLAIPAGGVTALVGPNGAGKSTLLTMMGRLLGADTGTVVVRGHDVTSTPSRELAKIMSILRQENHFVTRLTVRQLVSFGRFPHSQGRLSTVDEQMIDQALEFLNLQDLQHRYVDQLSGGQRQRSYVAMVLAQDTEVILLDEPLNSLDMKHARQMMQQLRRAADELGRTIVMVLHDVNFAARYSDLICAVKDGKVVEFGTPEEVMTPDNLTRIFDTPVDVLPGPHGPIAVYY